jgi:hypothetical protein
VNLRARFCAVWKLGGRLSAPALGFAWLLGFLLGARNDVLIWFYYLPAPAVALFIAAWLVIHRRHARSARQRRALRSGGAGGEPIIEFITPQI